ncbi:MAG: SMP-30/gluconolactonase/LRE family protein [Bdellovibrionota bacterium]
MKNLISWVALTLILACSERPLLSVQTLPANSNTGDQTPGSPTVDSTENPGDDSKGGKDEIKKDDGKDEVDKEPADKPIIPPVEPPKEVGICEQASSADNFPADLKPVEVSMPRAKDFLEGPVWIESEQALVFSAWDFSGDQSNGPMSSILRLQGLNWTIYSNSGVFGTNGIAIDSKGRLLGALHDKQQIAFLSADGKREVIASSFEGKTFNSPNDLTVRSDGVVYFVDPDYQKAGRAGQPVTGVYGVKTNGEVFLVDKTIPRPNGIILTLDEKTLYVGGEDGAIHRYKLAADGTTTREATDFVRTAAGVDGLGIDCQGNLYFTLPSIQEVHIYSPAGKLYTRIKFPLNTTNIAFGGADKKTMFVTTAGRLYKVDMKVPGLPY